MENTGNVEKDYESRSPEHITAYQDWLDTLAKQYNHPQNDECENVSVECSVNNHKECGRKTCHCACHVDVRMLHA